MADAVGAADKKALGRKQKIAVWGYGIGAFVAMVPTYVTLGVALARDHMDAAMACADKAITFAEVYGLVAVGSVLAIAGVVTGIGSAAEAVAKVLAARKGS